MSKQVVYLAVSYGVDGRAPESISFASLHESVRDGFISGSPNKNWLTAVDRAIDLAEVSGSVWDKLSGLEQLALIEHPFIRI